MPTTHQSINSRRCVRTAVGMLLVLVSLPGHTLSFWPNEAEWGSWPEYCRARYVVSAAGGDSEYSTRVDRSQIPMWKSRLGDAWYGLHHHCAGIVLMERAMVEQNPTKRERLLRDALGEHTFTLNRTSKGNPMHAEIATKLGLTHRALKENKQALRFFEMAIAEQPRTPGGYQGKAMLLRDQGRYSEARDTLIQGNKATEEQSPELQYFIGLVLCDMKDYATAREHARLAYKLGYPLPGLRDKLARAGYPL